MKPRFSRSMKVALFILNRQFWTSILDALTKRCLPLIYPRLRLGQIKIYHLRLVFTENQFIVVLYDHLVLINLIYKPCLLGDIEITVIQYLLIVVQFWLELILGQIEVLQSLTAFDVRNIWNIEVLLKLSFKLLLVLRIHLLSFLSQTVLHELFAVVGETEIERRISESSCSSWVHQIILLLSLVFFDANVVSGLVKGLHVV